MPVPEFYSAEHWPTRSSTTNKNMLQNDELLAPVFIAKKIDLVLEKHRSGASNYTRELRAPTALALWGQC